jgi:hypothetical protein
MARLFGAQGLVLQAILDSPKDTSGFVTDARVAQRTSIALDDVRDWLDTLDGEGLVEVASTTAGLSAMITAKGRLLLGLYVPTVPPHGGDADPASPVPGELSVKQQPRAVAGAVSPSANTSPGLPVPPSPSACVGGAGTSPTSIGPCQTAVGPSTAGERNPLNLNPPIVPLFKVVVTIRNGTMTVPLARTRITFGRGTDCDVVLPDPYLSRATLALDWDQSEQTFILLNLTSRIPIGLNDGRVIGPRDLVRLAHGDSISVGTTVIEFLKSGS